LDDIGIDEGIILKCMEIGEGLDWINVANNKDKWWAVLKSVMALYV
jgi:hypothetical protein